MLSQELARQSASSCATVRGQLLVELVKCVRADPEAITKHGLQRHVFAALHHQDEPVSPFGVLVIHSANASARTAFSEVAAR